jgi:hypothetical protein
MFSNVHDYQVTPGDCSASPDVIGVALLWKQSREVPITPATQMEELLQRLPFLKIILVLNPYLAWT